MNLSIDRLDLNGIKFEANKVMRGANSAYGLCDRYFLKILTEKPPIHDLIVSGGFNKKFRYVPKIVNYQPVSYSEFEKFKRCHNLDLRAKNLAHLYVFERISFEKIPFLINKWGITKVLIKKIIASTSYVFNRLHQYGYTYHDACWENIVWNRDEQEVFVIDIDSAVRQSLKEIPKGKGQGTFHQIYLTMKETHKRTKRKFNDLRFLNTCIITNMFISFILGYYFNDKGMFLNTDYSANKISRGLLKKDLVNDPDLGYALRDPDLNTSLTYAMKCLHKCIEHEKVGYIIDLIDLVDDIPSFYIKKLIAAKVNVKKGNIERAKRDISFMVKRL